MESSTDGMRFVVEEEAGRAVFARHLEMLQQRRVEAAAVPVRGPALGVLHLTLGVQPIALLDAEPAWSGATDGDGHALGERLQLTEYFPDLDLR